MMCLTVNPAAARARRPAGNAQGGRLWKLGAPLLVAWALSAAVFAAEPAVTVLADFEGASVAAQIGEVRNVPAGDCALRRVQIPARGQGSLALTIGATARDTSVVVELTFREPIRFQQIDRLASYCWINEGEVGLSFRLRDAEGRLFEVSAGKVNQPHRWVRMTAEVRTEKLQRVRGEGGPTYPLEPAGYRITTNRLGRQTIYLDDLQVEQRVSPEQLIRGEFEFDEPTRIYEPGSAVRVALLLENCSRQKQLLVRADLAWMRPDGSVLQRQRADVNLPASGEDFRSRRRLDFSQRAEEPGLYRLVAQVYAGGGSTPNTIETTIAVTPSARRVSRGRSTFFGVRANLLREPDLDQELEISVARDIGVNLLAIEAPWRLIEPKRGAVDFSALDAVVNRLTQKDVAPLLVLTDPPEWAPADAAGRAVRAAELIGALYGHFGDRLRRYQLDGSVLAATDPLERLAEAWSAADTLRKRLPTVELLPPALPVEDTPPTALAEFARRHPDFPLVLQTTGRPADGLNQLEDLRSKAGIEWRAEHVWMHLAGPLAGAGTYEDAEEVLRYYIGGAAAGVGTVIWSDLRDDDNDPSNAAALRGLIRRDFSPKTTALGYSAVAGTLTGYRCVGPVRGAPPEFESALFIGANRQVAVLLPRGDCRLPALLAPVSGVPGEWSAQDFERRALTVLTSAAPPLIPTTPRPMIITLTTRQAQSEQQLSLARPWLRLTRPVLAGADQELIVELDAPIQLSNSYLQVRLPDGTPLKSSLTATTLRASPGETVTLPIRLTPPADREFDLLPGTLRVSLEGEILDVPLDIRPVAALNRLDAGELEPVPRYRLGELAGPSAPKPSARVAAYGAWGPDRLVLLVQIEDDRFVPYARDKRGLERGDYLLVGVTRVGSGRSLRGRITPANDTPTFVGLGAGDVTLAALTRCVVRAHGSGGKTCLLEIPAEIWGGGKLGLADYLLLTCHYVDDDADGLAAVRLSWGGEVAGQPANTAYRWVVLAE